MTYSWNSRQGWPLRLATSVRLVLAMVDTTCRQVAGVQGEPMVPLLGGSKHAVSGLMLLLLLMVI
jgi:hypothetical protein